MKVIIVFYISGLIITLLSLVHDKLFNVFFPNIPTTPWASSKNPWGCEYPTLGTPGIDLVLCTDIWACSVRSPLPVEWVGLNQMSSMFSRYSVFSMSSGEHQHVPRPGMTYNPSIWSDVSERLYQILINEGPQQLHSGFFCILFAIISV